MPVLVVYRLELHVTVHTMTAIIYNCLLARVFFIICFEKCDAALGAWVCQFDGVFTMVCTLRLSAQQAINIYLFIYLFIGLHTTYKQ